jgi:hypothetical protein
MAPIILKQVLIPTRLQAVVSLITSLVVIGLTFSHIIYDQLVHYSAVSSGDVQSAYRSDLAFLNSYGFVQTGVIALFWIGVAVMMYVVYLAISNAVIEARNEVVIETEFANKPTWMKLAAGSAKQIGLALLLVAFLIISAKLLLPLWLSLFAGFISSPVSALGLLQALGSIIFTAINLYLAWALGQLVFMRS